VSAPLLDRLAEEMRKRLPKGYSYEVCSVKDSLSVKDMTRKRVIIALVCDTWREAELRALGEALIAVAERSNG
jgi:hypothetical protein